MEKPRRLVEEAVDVVLELSELKFEIWLSRRQVSVWLHGTVLELNHVVNSACSRIVFL